jgi:hypothetical protein
MAKSRPGPETETNNPDGCIIGKKEAKTVKGSVEVLSTAFLDSAKKISASIDTLANKIFSIISRLEKVSLKPSTSSSKGSGGGSKEQDPIAGYKAKFRIGLATIKKQMSQRKSEERQIESARKLWSNALRSKAKKEKSQKEKIAAAERKEQNAALKRAADLRKLYARAWRRNQRSLVAQKKREKTLLEKEQKAVAKRAEQQSKLLAKAAEKARRAIVAQKKEDERKAKEILRLAEKARKFMERALKKQENEKRREESQIEKARRLWSNALKAKVKKEIARDSKSFSEYAKFKAQERKAKSDEAKKKLAIETKKKQELAIAIDELRSKFPRLTKLFIDGPAKLKEEFKYWSGVMATGWSFASSVTKSGAKLLRKGWDIAYKAVNSYINQDDYEESQSSPTVNPPAETTENKSEPIDNTEKQIDELVLKIEKSESRFNSIFSEFKDTIDSLKANSGTDALAGEALLALNELIDAFGKVDTKEFEDKFWIAGHAIGEFARDLPKRAEDPTQNLTEAEKNLVDFTHKMTLLEPLQTALDANKTIVKSIVKLKELQTNAKNTSTPKTLDASEASALLALKDLAESFGKVDAKDFEEKFRIAGNAVIELAGALSIKEINGEALTEAEKNLAEFAHKMGLVQPLEMDAQTNKSILESIKKLEEILKTKSSATKPATLASGGPATPSKDDAKGTDTVPAMLTPGEFVVNKDATKKNRGTLEQINNGGKTQKKASGGRISYLAKGTPSGSGGSPAPSTPAPAAAISPFIAGLTLAGKSLGVLSTVGNLAVGSITGTLGAFSQITAFAGSFVQAFNPALMEQMNLVFKDLTAVIGMGLEPVIGAVIPIVRAFADRLVPVMQAMIPTVQLFADSMIELAGPIIEILIQAFAALEPIIVMAAGLVEMWAGILTWAVPLIAAAIKEIVYWFTKIVSTVQWVVGSLIVGIGKVLSMIPGTGNAGKDLQKVGENAIESSKKASKATDDYYNGTSKVQKAIQKPMVKGASVGAAAGKASFSGISDLGRNLMQSAMSSSTQASAIRTAENTQKTVEVLTKMDERMSRVPLPNPAAPARGARV